MVGGLQEMGQLNEGWYGFRSEVGELFYWKLDSCWLWSSLTIENIWDLVVSSIWFWKFKTMESYALLC